MRIARNSFFKYSTIMVALGALSVGLWAQQAEGKSVSVASSKGVPRDWSHQHLVFSNPGTEAAAIKNGTHERWLKVTRSQRYALQVARRSGSRSVPQLAAKAEDTPKIEKAIQMTPPTSPGKDWSVPMLNGVAASLSGSVVGTGTGGALSSNDIGGTSTFKIDGITFAASAPVAASQTGSFSSSVPPTSGDTITVGSLVLTINNNGGIASFGNGSNAGPLPAAGSSISIGGTTYTFNTAANCEVLNTACVLLGASPAQTAGNLRAAMLNSTPACSHKDPSTGNCFWYVIGANPVTALLASYQLTLTNATGATYPLSTTSGTINLSSAKSGFLPGASNDCTGNSNVPPTGTIKYAASSATSAANTKNAINACLASYPAFGVSASIPVSGTVKVSAATPGSSGAGVPVTYSTTSSTPAFTWAGGTLTGANLDGVTSASGKTFSYWSGNNYISPAALATNLATVINGQATTKTKIAATTNGPQLTMTALNPGSIGNNYSVLTTNFKALPWSVPTLLSGGQGAAVQPNVFPAIWTASLTTASCSDFVVYPTGVPGSTTAANLIAYSNLYSGFCPQSGSLPSVLWAVNLGTGLSISTSPIFSADGSQMAAIASDGKVAYLVLLKWIAGAGSSVTAPVTPTNSATAAAYLACAPTLSAPCLYTIPFGNSVNDTYSAPFDEYDGSDTLVVGDDQGNLHKFTGVFNGAPAEVGSPWVSLGSGVHVASPVYDPVSDNIFVGDFSGTLYSVSNSTGSVTSTGSLGDTIADAPLVDPYSGAVYAFVTTSSVCSLTGDNMVVRLPTTFSSFSCAPGVAAGVGTGLAGYYLYAGTFDNVYYSTTAAPAVGNLYLVGNIGISNGTTSANLYQVPVSASGLGTPNTVFANLTQPVTGVYPWPSPLNEFCNAGTSSCSLNTAQTQTTVGTDYIFFSINRGSPMGCTKGAGHGCAVVFNVSNPSSVKWSSSLDVPTPATSTAGCWATGGMVVDDSATSAGASQFYFVKLNGAAAGGPGLAQTSSQCSSTTSTAAAPALNATQTPQ